MSDDNPVITVHCIFGRCDHKEQGTDPIAVHDAMEAHYRKRHY